MIYLRKRGIIRHNVCRILSRQRVARRSVTEQIGKIGTVSCPKYRYDCKEEKGRATFCTNSKPAFWMLHRSKNAFHNEKSYAEDAAVQQSGKLDVSADDHSRCNQTCRNPYVKYVLFAAHQKSNHQDIKHGMQETVDIE